ncbi:uncharacterized protein LOC144648195 [Oculina patagonica]
MPSPTVTTNVTNSTTSGSPSPTSSSASTNVTNSTDPAKPPSSTLSPESTSVTNSTANSTSSSSSPPPPTTEPTTEPPVKPTTSPSEKSPRVTCGLTVRIDCSGGNLQVRFGDGIVPDIIAALKIAAFFLEHWILRGISCNSPLRMEIDMSFYSPIPEGKTIQGVFEEALQNGSIRNLTTNNTEATFTFVGTNITYEPKVGQCKQVCCDGAGGEMIVVPVCTPADKCEGNRLPAEKKEGGHCPGDSKGTCTEKCEDGGIHNSPNFAVVILLAIATIVNFQ